MTHEARARLRGAFSEAVAGLRETARAYDAPVEENTDALRVTFRLGTLDLSPAGDMTTIALVAREAAGLQLLRDLVAERIDALGLGLDWEGARAGRLPGNLSLARVEAVERVSPCYTRVRISGPDLARFGRGGLHFRLLFGPPDVDWPLTDDGGVTRWPGGMAAWHRPVYTTREIRLLGGAAARLTFDVFRHAGGRVTAWTDRARPGDEIAITGPGGGEQPVSAWMGLVGDETAVPVIARILAAAQPETRGSAILFVPEISDIQTLARPAGVSVRWVTRAEAETPLDALRALGIPEGDRLVFFAAERGEATLAREWLRARGLGRGEFQAAAYWAAPGAADD